MMRLVVVAVAASLLGQVAAPRPAFEVVSIKRSEQLDPGPSLRWLPGGTFRIRNLPTRGLLASAYGTPQRPPPPLIGAPDWVATERYDVTAKVGADLAGRPQADWIANQPGLLQSLLEERFKLKAHRETRELPVYVVRVANEGGRLGPQLHPSSLDCEKERTKCFFRAGPGHQTGGSADIATIVLSVTNSLGRVVIDRTGLSGKYDFDVEWSPDQTSTDKPSLFAAVREQLGLRIDSERAPVEVLVVDHIERPTEN
jgi:uncharacterized protein (TIGR03435 family)